MKPGHRVERAGHKLPHLPLHSLRQEVRGIGAAQASHQEQENQLDFLLAGGLWKLGRCVPAQCSPEDVAKVNMHFRSLFLQGLHNFMDEVMPGVMSRYEVVSLNCHTAEEEVIVCQY
jgi:hypothetical protein